jgi:hypothetical protein
MSYRDDAGAVERFEKLRMLALVIASALLALSLVTDIPWLHWPRGLAWLAAGVASFYEARAIKRLGRDPDSSYLRAALCVIVGVVCVL